MRSREPQPLLISLDFIGKLDAIVELKRAGVPLPFGRLNPKMGAIPCCGTTITNKRSVDSLLQSLLRYRCFFEFQCHGPECNPKRHDVQLGVSSNRSGTALGHSLSNPPTPPRPDSPQNPECLERH